jgi:hypothetical protein
LATDTESPTRVCVFVWGEVLEAHQWLRIFAPT